MDIFRQKRTLVQTGPRFEREGSFLFVALRLAGDLSGLLRKDNSAKAPALTTGDAVIENGLMDALGAPCTS